MKNTIGISIALCGLLIAINATAAENPSKNILKKTSEINNESQKPKYHITEIKALDSNSNFVPMFIPINFNDLTPESKMALQNYFKNAQNNSNEGVTVFEVENK